MPTNSARIHTKMPARPDWLKVNSSLNFPLAADNIKELAAALAEAQSVGTPYANVAIYFTGGRDIVLEVSFNTP